MGGGDLVGHAVMCAGGDKMPGLNSCPGLTVDAVMLNVKNDSTYPTLLYVNTMGGLKAD